MTACETPRCRLGSKPHISHWDGKEFWPNEGFRPPPSRKRPGRARADRISRQAHDLMTGVRDRVRASVPTEQRTGWTEEAWLDNARAIFEEFRAIGIGTPFTTPEDLWPCLPDPLPDVDRRIVRRLVSEALSAGTIREVSAKRLRGTYHTAEGHEFQMNKIVPVYEAVRRA